ncbi:MAG: imidazole glycerol phosphate synthase subunit HisH [Lachnospiraceae bacterium]|nr:imidazole glycerol phosphate synthase subunit HisH [Lachnospiraceae bacterium]
MVAIVDYGVGNVFSLEGSLKELGATVVYTKDPKQIKQADRVILPGVGAFGDASEKLFKSGLVDLLKEEVIKGKPFMGICLGMQLMFEEGYEYGRYPGLGLIEGSVQGIENYVSKKMKIPHMGWNHLHLEKESPLFKYVKEDCMVYFVHSYHGVDCEKSRIATTDYGGVLTAAVQKENVFGCQFHPEKSGETGLNILKAFLEV